jgi:hypothetical protein
MTKKKAPRISEKPNYSPTADERAAIEKAFDTRKIPPAPRLKIENRTISLDHPDELTGALLLQNALGTLDDSFATALIQQLAQSRQRAGKVDQLSLNFMLSFIKGIEPRDQVESTLAAQMAAVHMEVMRFAGRLGHIENLAQQDSALRAFNQLARTFATQLEALKRYRTGGEQKVTVQHVSVSEGGQAIVGNVTQAPREAGPIKPSSALTMSQKIPVRTVGQRTATTVPLKQKPGK